MANVRPDEKSVAQAAGEGAREASEQTETLIRTAARATAHNVSANAETAAQATEPFRKASGFMTETASQLTQRTADQFLSVFGFSGEQPQQALRAATANIDAIAKSTSVVAEGAQTVSRECLGLARDRMERNLKQWERLVACRSFQDIAAAQTELLRENMEQTFCSVRRLAELSMQTKLRSR
jgi:phasin family protein